MFPTAVRGTAASIGAGVDWLANFVVIVAFPVLTTAMGLPWVMVLLSGLSIVAVFEEQSGTAERAPSVKVPS